MCVVLFCFVHHHHCCRIFVISISGTAAGMMMISHCRSSRSSLARLLVSFFTHHHTTPPSFGLKTSSLFSPTIRHQHHTIHHAREMCSLSHSHWIKEQRYSSSCANNQHPTAPTEKEIEDINLFHMIWLLACHRRSLYNHGLDQYNPVKEGLQIGARNFHTKPLCFPGKTKISSDLYHSRLLTHY